MAFVWTGSEKTLDSDDEELTSTVSIYVWKTLQRRLTAVCSGKYSKSQLDVDLWYSIIEFHSFQSCKASFSYFMLLRNIQR